MENEIWKNIKEFNGNYQISNYGRIKSFKHNCGIKEKILKNAKDGDGYFIIRLYKIEREKPNQ